MAVTMSMAAMRAILAHVGPVQAKAAVAKAIGDGRDGSLKFSTIEEHSATPVTGVNIDVVLAGFEHLTVTLRALNGRAAKAKATTTKQSTKNTVAMAKTIWHRNLPVTQINAAQNCVGGHLKFTEVEVITTATGVSTYVNVNTAFRFPDFGHQTVTARTDDLLTKTLRLVARLTIRLLATTGLELERLTWKHSTCSLSISE